MDPRRIRFVILLGFLIFTSDPGITTTDAFHLQSGFASRRNLSLNPKLNQHYHMRQTCNNVKNKVAIVATRRQRSRNASTRLFATATGGYNLVKMIAKNSNHALVAATAATTVAIIVSVVSWRKTKHLQEELRLLKSQQNIASTTTHDGQERGNENENETVRVEKYIPDVRNANTTQQPIETNHEATTSPSQLASSYKHRISPSSFPSFETEATETNHGTTTTTTTQLAVNRIGIVRSIYRLCVGTPRQGLLAPDARGRLELDKIGDSSTEAIVDGLEGFGYVWILFHFHLNTSSANPNRKSGFKSKIAPPALGGKKVGIYATRSPHRHNPIGITLCKLDEIAVRGPHDVTLMVSGLDLVDGTPVLDIKPYVPVYDSVQLETIYPDLELPPPKVPGWVKGGLATRRNVVVTPHAKNELETLLRDNPKALEFYGPRHSFKGNASAENTSSDSGESSTAETVIRVIRQVLSIDVRSAHQTKKARGGRSQAQRAMRVRSKFDADDRALAEGESPDDDDEMCTQQLDNLLIFFTVTEKESKARGSSEGSGAEDEITVRRIRLIPKTSVDKGTLAPCRSQGSIDNGM